MPRAVLVLDHQTSGKAQSHELQRQRSTNRTKDQEKQCCFRYQHSVTTSIHHAEGGNVDILKGTAHHALLNQAL